MSFIRTAAAFAAALLLAAAPVRAQDADPENTLVIEVDAGGGRTGQVRIELLPQVAPNHVERIKTLAGQGFYDGIVFHRVIPGFMAQTGDPLGKGYGGSDLPDVRAEFSNVPYVRGTVGMARSNDPHSANSQFFIMYADGSFLNGKYTVWGQVIDGMEIIDALPKGEPPANPGKMVRVRLASEF